MLTVFIRGACVYDGVKIHCYIPALDKNILGVISYRDTYIEPTPAIYEFEKHKCFCGTEIVVFTELNRYFATLTERICFIRIGDSSPGAKPFHYVVDRFLEFMYSKGILTEDDTVIKIWKASLLPDDVLKAYENDHTLTIYKDLDDPSVSSGTFFDIIHKFMLDGGCSIYEDPLFYSPFVRDNVLRQKSLFDGELEDFWDMNVENTICRDTPIPTYRLQFGGLLPGKYYKLKGSGEFLSTTDKRKHYIYVEDVNRLMDNRYTIITSDLISNEYPDSGKFSIYYYEEITREEFMLNAFSIFTELQEKKEQEESEPD